MEILLTSKALMKNLKQEIKNKIFTIGTSMDFDTSWSFQIDKVEQNVKIIAPQSHNLLIKKEKRNKKIVTIIGKFFIEKNDSDILLSEIKKYLGTGGSFKNGELLIQGDVQIQCKIFLIKHNFKVI